MFQIRKHFIIRKLINNKKIKTVMSQKSMHKNEIFTFHEVQNPSIVYIYIYIVSHYEIEYVISN